ncbi:MAG: hypothetical protein IPI55_11810 [Flavobacteriales bacterium]|nr:hypothetical protein [Flavobacteriales bacterium]
MSDVDTDTDGTADCDDGCPNDPNKVAPGNCGCGVAEGTCLDCAGIVNGTATMDACGICSGGTTGITPNSTCLDCAGIVNGTATMDACGICSVAPPVSRPTAPVSTAPVS